MADLEFNLPPEERKDQRSKKYSVTNIGLFGAMLSPPILHLAGVSDTIILAVLSLIGLIVSYYNNVQGKIDLEKEKQ